MNNAIYAQYKELGMRITLEAIKEFSEERRNHNRRKQSAILKQLRSQYMICLSNGLSTILADKLEDNPDEVCSRLENMPKEED